MRTKCIIFGETLRIRIKKFKQNLPKSYSKSTNIAITTCKFSKFFRGSMPPDHPRAFLVFKLASNLFCQKKKKYAQKLWKLCPPLLKFLSTSLLEYTVLSFLQHFKHRHCMKKSTKLNRLELTLFPLDGR